MITVTQFQQDMAVAEKRRKGRDRPGHDQADAGPLTPAHAGAEAEMDAHPGEPAVKAQLDAQPGPGTFPRPGEISPQEFTRPYQEAGHTAVAADWDAVRLPGAAGPAGSR